MFFIPTGFEKSIDGQALRCRGKILEVDNNQVQEMGMVKSGDQGVSLKILEGRFKGRVLKANNPILGQMDRDKIFKPGDIALVVLTLDKQGKILYVNPQEHYRLGLELLMLSLFALLLLSFGGWTGFKALLSFLFAALIIWKILTPLMLKGYDPILTSLSIVALLCFAIIFLVAGINKKGLVAFCGAFLGVLTSCLMAILFTKGLHIHGAVMPFSETLLYSGFEHLNLTKIYVAAVFLACSGAVMDLSMDVAASMYEIKLRHPEISRKAALKSGINVGRSVVGTITTTLLLAYSGSFLTLLMVFMAQGIPLANTFNLVYVAAEIMKTLVGSFGLVTVAPFTALMGSIMLSKDC
jgi:uncharacterized membrane protein